MTESRNFAAVHSCVVKVRSGRRCLLLVQLRVCLVSSQLFLSLNGN